MTIRRLAPLGWLLAVLTALTVLATAAAAQPGKTPGKRAKAAAKGIDLATYPAKRWIVQLRDPALARYRGGIAGYQATAGTARRLNVSSRASRAYLRRLARTQRGFSARLNRVVRTARVERSYRVTLNAIAVRMSPKQAAKVRTMRGVRAVTPDIPYHLDMYATPEQIGATALWPSLGGQANAGAGVKVAIIDSGIFVRKNPDGTYAGNPCFNDAGYTAPAGYPKGDTRFTNNKVLVARSYFRPDDPPTAGNETPIPGDGGSSHGTHVAGTVACNAGTTAVSQGATVTLSGIAPRAYLMNYRVFYPSQSPEAFQNGNAYVVELVHAIEDAVADGADVISNSWGSSHQNTFAWPDPMVQASEAAVDAGVTMVYAQGNSGNATGTGNSPANSPKVIAVGAVSKSATIVPGRIDVTAPVAVPPAIASMDVGSAAFGAQVTTTFGPAPVVAVETVATGPNPTLACAALPAGSLAGKIAVIERGVCEFSTKVLNAQNAGAVAALIYNSAANGDNLQAMGAGVAAPLVTIPSWFLRRSQGLALAAFATANPGTQATFTFAPHPAANIGDVMAGFSSLGPTQEKTLKPDVVAPGVDVLSGGYAPGGFPNVFLGFGPQNGTSMSTPHVAGAAALLKQAHPSWKPWQIKSALMTTATENVFLDTGRVNRAGVLARGSGRINVADAANATLLLDQPSLSVGEVRAGGGRAFSIDALGAGTGVETWDVSAVETGSAATTANFDIVPGTASITVAPGGHTSVPVNVTTVGTAAPGSYEGAIVLTKRGTGTTLHAPVWLRVVQAPVKDVLLVDDDGSTAGADPAFADYSARYTALLDSLGVSYDYVDAWETGFPSLNNLYKYRVILVFTGDNNSFDTSGFTLAQQDALAEWLNSGGRLWTTGQNFAEASDSNGTSDRLGRARLYNGYLGLAFEAGSVFGTAAAPRPTAAGVGPMSGLTLDLSPGGNGAGNQTSIEASSPIPDTDTYAAQHTTTPLFRQTGGAAPAASAVSFGRSSEPSLEEMRQEYLYRAVSMGFGIEALNSNTGFAGPQQVGDRVLDWLLDQISVDASRVIEKKAPKKKVTFTAQAVSSVGASFTQYRWDFGDGSPIVTTTSPTVFHKYKRYGDYRLRVEATDSLGHRQVHAETVTLDNK